MVIRQDRATKLILVLILIILILVGIMTYSFVIQPAINGFVIGKQVEAKDITLNALISQIQQQGFVQISDAEGNSLSLVAVESLIAQIQQQGSVQITDENGNAFTLVPIQAS